METVQRVVDIQTADGLMAVPTSRPVEGGTRPAVIVVMGSPGVSPNIVGIVDRFAQEGYVAVAPDLYHRAGRLRWAPAEKRQEMQGELRANGFSDASIDMDVKATLDYLRSDPGVSTIGITGFCLGGRVSLQTAIRASGLSAAGIFYGGNMFPGDDRPEAFSAIRESATLAVPVIGFFGEEDQNPTAEEARSLDAHLTNIGKEHAFYYYEGAGHAFFNDDSPGYRPGPAADSWEKILEFFDRHLRRAGSPAASRA
ncbi:MAG: dienelactone hydrolase family protein [Chloroflexota bacterium]|nr:dienelactone hydrolase family protein [Chloroflexota bacterium]MDE2886248.1 dienelactone hydrolase family protein [Chloroflexota bacterium]